MSHIHPDEPSPQLLKKIPLKKPKLRIASMHLPPPTNIMMNLMMFPTNLLKLRMHHPLLLKIHSKTNRTFENNQFRNNAQVDPYPTHQDIADRARQRPDIADEPMGA